MPIVHKNRSFSLWVSWFFGLSSVVIAQRESGASGCWAAYVV
jgi:hypothetical protein